MKNIVIAFLLCLLIALCSQCVYISRSSVQSYTVHTLTQRIKNRTIFQTAILQARLYVSLENFEEYLNSAPPTDSSTEGSIWDVPQNTATEESSMATEVSSSSGTVLSTSKFEFTIPEDWGNKVALTESDAASTYHLYYMNGLTDEALQNGYYQAIFDINLFTSANEMAKVQPRKERFDIIGEKDGIIYVLTQRTDSALEFYDETVHEDIKAMMSGRAFPEIIASFTFY